MSLSLLLLLSLLSLSHAGVRTSQDGPPRTESSCKVSGVGDSLSLECSGITASSDCANPTLPYHHSHFKPIVHRVTFLKVTDSPDLKVARGDMNRMVLDECIAVVNSDPSSGLTDVIEIVLSHNKLTEIHSDTFSGFQNIKYIYLSRNEIATIDAAAFRNLHNLTELSLQDNKLTSFGDQLQALGLTKLNLENNLLTSVHDRMFSGMSKLKVLNLGENNFTSFDFGAFNSLTSLKKLEVRKSKLESLDSRAFENNIHLYVLDLTSTDMHDIQNFSLNISTLEFLFLRDCNISRITGAFFRNLPSLKGLSLESNHLTRVDDNLFAHLPQLRFATLMKNELTTLSVMSFRQMYEVFNRSPTVVAGMNYRINRPGVILCTNPWDYESQEMLELREWMLERTLSFTFIFQCV